MDHASRIRALPESTVGSSTSFQRIPRHRMVSRPPPSPLSCVGDLEVAQNLSDINLVWQCSDAGQVSTTTAALSPCSDGCINLFPCLIFFCDIQLGLVPVFFHARAQARRGRNKRAVPGRHRGGCLSSRAMRTTTTQSSTLAVGALRPKSPGRLLPSFHRQSPTGITRFRKRSPRQPRSTRT